MSSPFKKGNILAPSGIEQFITKGLTKEAVPLTKPKAYGADVGHCPRRVVAYTKVDPDYRQPISPPASFYMGIGTAIHEVIGTALENANVLLANEYYLKDNRIGPPAVKPTGGFVDDIIIDHEGHVAIVDVKSCGALPGKAKFEYENQVRFYAISSGITKGYILYVSRNVAKWPDKLLIRQFEVPMDKVSLRRSALTMARSHVYLNEGIIPPIPKRFKKSFCGFCPFIPMCWHEDGIVPNFVADAKFIDEPDEELEAKALELAKTLVSEMPKRLKWTKEWIAKYGTEFGKAWVRGNA